MKYLTELVLPAYYVVIASKLRCSNVSSGCWNNYWGKRSIAAGYVIRLSNNDFM